MLALIDSQLPRRTGPVGVRAVTPEESEANVKRSREQQAEEGRRIKEQAFLERMKNMALPGATPINDDVIRRTEQIYARECRKGYRS